MRVNKFIGPLVEVSLHVRRGTLNLTPALWSMTMSCIKKAEVGICLVFWLRSAKMLPWLSEIKLSRVRSRALLPISRRKCRTFPDWKSDGLGHRLRGPKSDPPVVLGSGTTMCRSWVLFVCKPSSNVGPAIWMCAGIASPPPVGSRVVGARLDLRMVRR